MDELRERVKARIAELKADRERYRIEAQKQLYAYDAVIGELSQLLKAPEGQGKDD